MSKLNFSAGPGALPEPVLQAARDAIEEVPELGISVLGVSHRSDWFRQVVLECEQHARALLQLPDSTHVLLLQGGSSLQFSMIPMLLLRGRKQPAEYLDTGYWSAMAIPEARHEGAVRVLWSGREKGYRRLPSDAELAFSEQASYLHYVSNETVEGLQFKRVLGHDGVPRVSDMSSDFLSGPIDVERFDLIYAHSQKNLGPAGVTLVVLKDQLLEHEPSDLPTILDYRPHAERHSIYNTPPVFAIYAVLLVLRWLRFEVGGLTEMSAINSAKAERLYRCIDADPDFYQPRAATSDRSKMNAVFNLPTPDLQERFIREAEQAGLLGLTGHRSLGGVRVSLYNGVTLEAVEILCGFMDAFRERGGLGTC